MPQTIGLEVNFSREQMYTVPWEKKKGSSGQGADAGLQMGNQQKTLQAAGVSHMYLLS